MPNNIQHKRSSTPGAVPVASALVDGELAVNTADGRVFLKKSDGSVARVGSDLIAEYETTSSFPATGDAQVLYVATDSGRQYQWSGSFYAEIGPDSAYVSAVDAGVLTGTVPRSTLPLASTSLVGAVQAGSGVNVNNGVISVTTSSIGAANASHQHDASDINAGTLDTARLPTNMSSALNLYLWSNFR